MTFASRGELCVHKLHPLECDCVYMWEYLYVCIFTIVWGCTSHMNVHESGVTVGVCLYVGVQRCVATCACEDVKWWVCEYVCVCVFEEH